MQWLATMPIALPGRAPRLRLVGESRFLARAERGKQRRPVRERLPLAVPDGLSHGQKTGLRRRAKPQLAPERSSPRRPWRSRRVSGRAKPSSGRPLAARGRSGTSPRRLDRSRPATAAPPPPTAAPLPMSDGAGGLPGVAHRGTTHVRPQMQVMSTLLSPRQSRACGRHIRNGWSRRPGWFQGASA